ncbi:MAG: hypothetical protein KKI08_10705, partial [Armatimonadetes bacterium]|nr:hypothetical protein [Armatimonadota bacterium]
MACHGFPLGLSLFVAVAMLIPVGAGAAPDWSRLSLKGNGHVQDHFSLAVQAGARMLGRDLDYEALYVLSGNAFAPCLDPTESCTSWWMTGTGRDANADLIARRLGLQLRRIPSPWTQNAPPMPVDKAALEQWLRDHWRVPAVPGIREALERGEVILTSGRWSGSGPHGFTPWSWWGIIAEARDDGTVVGACLNGHRDNPMAAVDDMLALSLGTP